MAGTATAVVDRRRCGTGGCRVGVRLFELEDLGERLPQVLKPAARRARDLVDGNWPSEVAVRRLARTPRDPRTFSEKVRYRAAFDRRPILTSMVDKVAVRDYVRERLGDEVLTPVVGAFDDPGRIPWRELPREYVVKATHGSGAVVVVFDGAPAGNRLPGSARFCEWERFAVRPEHASPPRIVALGRRWLELDYSHSPGHVPEWGYRDVPRRVLVEHLVPGTGGELPTDYKFMCFDGTCPLFYVVGGRFTDHRIAVFDGDGSPSAIRFGPHPDKEHPPLVPHWRELKAAAEELSRGLDFVRVDIYPVGTGMAFGEMTMYHDGGRNSWEPASADELIGSWWKVPDDSVLRGD
ncbi:MAG: hypothetical protein GC157_08915 [Frankiales bacterium]|nr:hypothetical protein [Frankiales bacterium]